jgi:Flp pilus assembly protein TadG
MRSRRVFSRLWRSGRDQRGAVLIIVAIILPFVLLGFAALAIDLGSFSQQQRQAQSAADAAALAGAQDLPGSATSATADAKSYVISNMPGVPHTYPVTCATPPAPGVCITTPVSSDTTKISVTVTENVPSFFGRIFGINNTNVSATATAQATNVAVAAPALFAIGTTCGTGGQGYGISFNASGISMPGGFVSNAGINQAGHNNVYGKSTYVPPCTMNYNGDTTDNTYNGVSAPGTSATASTPNTFSSFPSPSACTYGPSPLTTPSVVPAVDHGGTDLNLQNLTGNLPAGTYCYGSIEFNQANIVGNATFQAASFQLNASEPNLTPYYQSLLIYYTGTGTLNVDGTGNSYLTGGMYAPNATVNLNTPTGTINTFVEAQAIIVSGGNPLTWNSTLTTNSGASSFALTQ